MNDKLYLWITLILAILNVILVVIYKTEIMTPALLLIIVTILMRENKKFRQFLRRTKDGNKKHK